MATPDCEKRKKQDDLQEQERADDKDLLRDKDMMPEKKPPKRPRPDPPFKEWDPEATGSPKVIARAKMLWQKIKSGDFNEAMRRAQARDQQKYLSCFKGGDGGLPKLSLIHI